MITDKKLDQVLDDILRQIVCYCCGGYRHHGVNWMPEETGEGQAVARDILRAAISKENPPMAGIIENVTPDTKEILRVATKMNSELEAMDIFQHIAVVNILNQLVQHRGAQLDRRAAEAEKRLADQEPINPHLKN